MIYIINYNKISYVHSLEMLYTILYIILFFLSPPGLILRIIHNNLKFYGFMLVFKNFVIWEVPAPCLYNYFVYNRIYPRRRVFYNITGINQEYRRLFLIYNYINFIGRVYCVWPFLYSLYNIFRFLLYMVF